MQVISAMPLPGWSQRWSLFLSGFWFHSSCSTTCLDPPCLSVSSVLDLPYLNITYLERFLYCTMKSNCLKTCFISSTKLSVRDFLFKSLVYHIEFRKHVHFSVGWITRYAWSMHIDRFKWNKYELLWNASVALFLIKSLMKDCHKVRHNALFRLFLRKPPSCFYVT